MTFERDFIAVIDFGGQYAHLIAKRLRHLGVFSKIFHPTVSVADLQEAKGIILSGGPQSVHGQKEIPFNPEILTLERPILGLCYGHQLIAHHLGGSVRNLEQGEFGKTILRLEPDQESSLFAGVQPVSEVWMSHGDTVVEAPAGFQVIATSQLCPVAAMSHREKPIFGLQFHPEVTDTSEGGQIFSNFIGLTKARAGWNMETFVAEAIQECREQAVGRNVLMFLSGGVDSTVAYSLLTRALGKDRIKGLLIDTGFMRKYEVDLIMARYRELRFENVDLLEAGGDFLKAVAGLSDPQEKREAIGETFVKVRDKYLEKLDLDPAGWMLGQGTLYPDIIESGGTQYAEVIKSHHNRVGIIEELIAAGHVIEPLKELYKDEVRKLGMTLGLPEEIVWRHPFPGPGLAINVLCANGEESYPELEKIAASLEGLLRESPYQGRALPVRSVGVQGDSRTYTCPVVIYGPVVDGPVVDGPVIHGSQDWDLLEEYSIRITNSIRDVNRVVTLLAPESLPPLINNQAFCTKDRLDLLREADHLATKALENNGLMGEIFQLLVILLPLSLDGKGECLVLRPVVSEDVMTARFARIDWEILDELASQLLGLEGIDGVFYDITHKPPATFGWE